MDTPFDPKLLDYVATDAQRERLQAWLDLGSQEKAAAQCGCDARAIRKALRACEKRAAADGYAPGHWENGVAPGYRMGKVTVQRGPDGKVERAWERQHPDQLDWAKVFQDMLDGILDDLPAAPAKTFHGEAEDLLYVVPIGDAHFGSYSWAGDTGESYDLSIAQSRHMGGIDALMRAAPVCKEMVILNLGDFFDSNCSKNRTPRSGNIMDPSGTYGEILAAACKTTVYMINRALENAELVEYVGLIGNHDPEASAALNAFVHAWYRNEPRVKCQLLPHVYWYKKYGKNLIGSHHGHGCKPSELPNVMAVDCRADWADAEHCTWLIGHFHHSQLLAKEYGGATVEGFNTLASQNLHHYTEGYRARLTITGIAYHPVYGEWERHVRNVAAIEAGA